MATKKTTEPKTAIRARLQIYGIQRMTPAQLKGLQNWLIRMARIPNTPKDYSNNLTCRLMKEKK